MAIICLKIPNSHAEISTMDLPYELTDLLRLAYSAEKAAAFAYQGHAGSVKDEGDKIRIREIETDEWIHRDPHRCRPPAAAWQNQHALLF